MQMTDIKRIVLAAIFGLSVIILWNNWTIYNLPAPSTTAVSQNGQSGPSSSVSGVPSPSQNSAVAATPSASSTKIATTGQFDYSAFKTVTVKTDMVEVQISALGGDIIKMSLLKHRATGDKAHEFVLLDDGGDHTYIAQTGFLGEGMPTHKTTFEFIPGDYTLKDGQNQVQVRLTAKTEKGINVTKILTFKRGDYLVDVAYEVENTSTIPLATTAYFQLARDDRATEHSAGLFGGISTFTGPAFYTEEGKFQKVKFSDIEKNKAHFVKKAKDGWVSIIQHYFVAAFIPQEGTEREYYANKISKDFYSVGFMQNVNVAPGQKVMLDVPLYAGPQEQQHLKTIAPGLNLVVDYGWVTVIAMPLFWLLSTIHKFVGNWGWSIILLTILIKLVFFPLSATSYKSMARMKNLMPRVKQIQERNAGDKAKTNQEMMELYKREKVNPMGGCLPIVIQIPVFIALYWTLLSVVEMRQAPWLGWITDLSSKDPYYILPIIMGVTMLVQTKLNPTPPDPIQAKVMLAMPILFTFMFLSFPSGLVLYWIVNNSLSILQQWLITKKLAKSQPVAIEATTKKKE